MCTHLDKTGSTYYFRRVVPDDLAGAFTTRTGKARTEWKFSLHTKDREEAKRLRLPHIAETDRLIDEARQALRDEEPHPAPAEPAERAGAMSRATEQAEAAAAVDAARRARYEARQDYRIAARQRMMLSTAELSPEEAAWRDLVREQGQELETLQDAADAQRSVNERLGEGARGRTPSMGLMLLFARWAALPGRHEQVTKRWQAYVENLTTFLGHADANQITRVDLIRWRNHLRDDVIYRGKRLSAKTINDSYLAAVNAVLSYAVGDGLMDANPMDGVTKVSAPKAMQLRDRDLTMDEARIILRAASANPEADRHWLPWLMAYTGTRIGEPAQLRTQDVRLVDGVHVLCLTPDAGPIKNRKARLVPIHPHLIELGFLDFVAAHEPGYLFGGDAAKVSRRVGDWVRTLGITAPQPNHCWRHTFKTLARSVGMPELVADRIQGHAPRHEGGKYGSVPLATLKDAIEKLPRYEI
jgi:integrase